MLRKCFGIKSRSSNNTSNITNSIDKDLCVSANKSNIRGCIGNLFKRGNKQDNNLSNYHTHFLGKSFYDEDQYKSALHRIDTGVAMLDQFIDMLDDRRALEQDYAFKLSNWSECWKLRWTQSPDYGSNKATMFALLNSALEESQSRLGIADQLKSSLTDYIREWRLKICTNSRLDKIRTFCKHRFERETGNWQKFLRKIEHCKKAYHEACIKVNNGEAFKQIVESDSGTTDETKNNLRRQVNDLREKCAVLRNAYKRSVQEADDRKGLYIQNMNDIFRRCEELEAERLKLFRELFEKYLEVVLPPSSYSSHIKLNLRKNVESHDTQADLNWWSETYGPGTLGMTMWPRFEELNIC